MSLSIDRFAPTPAAKLGLALDLAAVAVAVSFATRAPLPIELGWMLCAVGVFWSTSSVVRHYGWGVDRPAWEDVILTAIILLSVLTVIGFLGWLLPIPAPSAIRVIQLALPLLLVLRLTIYAFIRAQTRPPRRMLIVGTGALGRITGEDLASRRTVCSYLSWAREPIPEPLRGAYLGESTDLLRLLKSEPYDEVYLCGLPDLHGAEIQAAVGVCETLGIPFALPAYTVRLRRAEPVAGRAVADGFLHYVSAGAVQNQRLLKRLLDIFASAAALWVLFPLLLAVAALVKLTSAGPVFFRQLRVGLHGKRFHMLKFRSMVVNAEELKAKLLAQNEQSGPVFKMKRDPRVTSLGRFLRKYSIDELPQLVNVLRGDMTLVGPRPPVPQEVAQYEPWQHRRLSVPPGLTCLWQVSGRNEIAFQDWMYLDLQYIDTWNLAQDLNLLLRTVPVVVSGRGSH
ncbi:MAG TPA: sugar transferase [Myxococcaceae bacterium]|nr:sugar transferase [Myxococcaceae bacterium]